LSSEGDLEVTTPKMLIYFQHGFLSPSVQLPYLHATVLSCPRDESAVTQPVQPQTTLAAMAIFYLRNQPEPSFQSVKTQTATTQALYCYCKVGAVSAETEIGELMGGGKVFIQAGDKVATYNGVLVVDAAV
jgi:hypothetical protein